MKAEWITTGDGLAIRVFAENDLDRVNFTQLFHHRKPFSKLRVNNTKSSAGGKIYQLTVGNMQYLNKDIFESYGFSGTPNNHVLGKIIGNSVIIVMYYNVCKIKKVVFQNNADAQTNLSNLLSAISSDKNLASYNEKPIEFIGFARTLGDLKELLNINDLR